MKNYTLGIYRISINKRSSKEDKVFLSDYDSGKDFLSQLFNLFESWKQDDMNGLVKDNDEKKISRILKDESNNTYILNKLGRYLSGIIESGEFGTEENIIDSSTGKLKYHKEKDDAPMIPFFFMFYIPEYSYYGYLIIERIGNIGIYSTLLKSIRNFIGPNIQDNFVLRIEPFILNEVLNKNLYGISNAKRIILKGVHHKDLDIQKISDNLVECDGIRTDLTFTAARNKSFGVKEWVDKLNSQRKKIDNGYKFQDVEYADIAFELKIGGKPKMISIERITALGTYIDITDDVEIGNNGYPTYKSISNEAQILLSYVKDEYEKKN